MRGVLEGIHRHEGRGAPHWSHLEDVERLVVEAKWLFLLPLDGLGTRLRKEPFQSFDWLIRFKNTLVHYTSRSGSLQSRRNQLRLSTVQRLLINSADVLFAKVRV